MKKERYCRLCWECYGKMIWFKKWREIIKHVWNGHKDVKTN